MDDALRVQELHAQRNLAHGGCNDGQIWASRVGWTHPKPTARHGILHMQSECQGLSRKLATTVLTR